MAVGMVDKVWQIVIGASLSEPHTSESSGESVAFTKIYVEIWIAWCVHKGLRLKSNYKPDNLRTYIDHTKNYQGSLLMLYVKLAHTFITLRITKVIY